MKDARALINQIDLFLLIQGDMRAKINFGLVDIARYNDEMWIGHYGNNLMKLCPSYDDIVDFVYKHRNEINQNIRKSKSDINVLKGVDWELVGEILREVSGDTEDEV